MQQLKTYIFNFGIIAFFIAWIFLCFQTAEIELIKRPSGEVRASITRLHFWGLIRFQRSIDNVKGVGISSERPFGSARRTSSVSIYSDTDDVPVFLGSSYVMGSDIKEQVLIQVNAFLRDKRAYIFSERYTEGGFFPSLIFIFIALYLWDVLGLNDWYIRLRRNK